MIEFDLPKDQASIIKVLGVGGGGCNAVNHMYEQGIKGVNFVVCNTDQQALEMSPIPNKIQLGPHLTEGLGAGSNPEVGRNAAMESLDELKTFLEKNTKMVFITAGMGGGTGTGGAPVIAKIAKDMGILTVGIVTTPFGFEGRRKMDQAEAGIEELRNNVDTILIVSNDRLREIYGNLTRASAFAEADNILTIAAKSIAEIITVPGQVNVDFADVDYVMRDSGPAIMGSAVSDGENRAMQAVEAALASPLLNDNDIKGAKHVLLNITTGTEQMLLDEITEVTEFVQEAAGRDSDVIMGLCDDESLGEKISVTIIATGFEGDQHKKQTVTKKVVGVLNEEDPAPPVADAPEMVSENTTEEEEPQYTIEFDVSKSKLRSEEDPNEEKEHDRAMQLKSRERIRKLKEISLNLRNPSSLNDMENEPAYQRRNVELEDTPHSSESNVSRFTLNEGEDEDDKPEIRPNNSFLHDNVD